MNLLIQKNRIKWALSLCFCLLWSTAVTALSASVHDLDLMGLGYFAGALGLHEAVTAKPQNPSAGLYNPAGLQGISKTTVQSMQNGLGDGIGLFALNGVLPIGKDWTLGLTWMELQVTDIPLTPTENASLNTDIAPNAWSTYGAHAVVGSVAYAVNAQCSVGLSGIGFIKSMTNVEQGRSYGLGLTPGIQYQLASETTLGAHLKNALSYTHWETGTAETFERIAVVGLAQQLGDFTVYTQWDMALSNLRGITGSIAADYTFANMIVFRAGAGATHLTGGLGLTWQGFSIDYAYVGSSAVRYQDGSRLMVGIQL
ncbi:MAG: hypothetical protein AB7F28_04525 [Candidatus Margulisiibacteriota bacterium]